MWIQGDSCSCEGWKGITWRAEGAVKAGEGGTRSWLQNDTEDTRDGYTVRLSTAKTEDKKHRRTRISLSKHYYMVVTINKCACTAVPPPAGNQPNILYDLSSWCWVCHKVTWRHPGQMNKSPQLALYDAEEQQLYFTSDVGCLTSGCPRSVKKTHSSHLYL